MPSAVVPVSIMNSTPAATTSAAGVLPGACANLRLHIPRGPFHRSLVAVHQPQHARVAGFDLLLELLDFCFSEQPFLLEQQKDLIVSRERRLLFFHRGQRSHFWFLGPLFATGERLVAHVQGLLAPFPRSGTFLFFFLLAPPRQCLPGKAEELKAYADYPAENRGPYTPVQRSFRVWWDERDSHLHFALSAPAARVLVEAAQSLVTTLLEPSLRSHRLFPPLRRRPSARGHAPPAGCCVLVVAETHICRHWSRVIDRVEIAWDVLSIVRDLRQVVPIVEREE
mmetsp:Transcript_21614/g.51279  ORF Transcript_21614/g.51279 Transcript_21614/m.51279 type:complete len:282 (-) Transcript_21614:5524-6369(-)